MDFESSNARRTLLRDRFRARPRRACVLPPPLPPAAPHRICWTTSSITVLAVFLPRPLGELGLADDRTVSVSR